MTKKTFCRTMKKIEDIWHIERQIDGILGAYGKTYHEDITFGGVCTSLITDIIDLLSEILHDKYEDINYFCWELDFGKKWKPGCIKDEKGNDINLSTAEKLYDYLKGAE